MNVDCILYYGYLYQQIQQSIILYHETGWKVAMRKEGTHTDAPELEHHNIISVISQTGKESVSTTSTLTDGLHCLAVQSNSMMHTQTTTHKYIHALTP